MRNTFQQPDQKKPLLKQFFKFLGSWAGAIIIVIILHFTGLLSSISYFAQSAMLRTGLMDASSHALKENPEFIYDFKIKDLDGNKIDFTQFKNKVIFLNLWATWCGPCRAEMPTIQKLHDKLSDDPNIVFIMLSIDKDKDLPKVVRYLKDKGYTFGSYLPSGYLTEQINVPNIPTTFIISKEGKIIGKEVGTTNFDTNRFYKFLKAESAR